MATAQPGASLVTILLSAAVAAVILTTTGQTVQAEQLVLSRIDDVGTRSVIITDTEGRAGMTPASVSRISSLSGVDWVIGLGPAIDSRNAGLGRVGAPVAVRSFYGDIPNLLVTDAWPRQPGTALVGIEAASTLGLVYPFGGLDLTDDTQKAVVGGFEALGPLGFLNSSILAASSENSEEKVVRSILILTERPEDVAVVADAAVSVLGARDLRSVGVQTSEAFADVRAAVAGELGFYSRRLVTLVLGAGLVLVGLNVYGSVTTRRRDFGRRRALGATRPTIINLVFTRVLVTAGLGASLGALIATGIVVRLTGQAPDWAFTIAIAILTTLSAGLAALPPAVVAAFRDPLSVLRVP